jgi:hypothetical protein
MTNQQPPPPGGDQPPPPAGGWGPPPPSGSWGPPPPPQPTPSSGRLVASIIAGGILGTIAGAFAASLLDAALGVGTLLPLVMLPLAATGGLIGALVGMRRGRRLRRPPRSMEDWRRRPNRIVDVRRRDRREG